MAFIELGPTTSRVCILNSDFLSGAAKLDSVPLSMYDTQMLERAMLKAHLHLSDCKFLSLYDTDNKKRTEEVLTRLSSMPNLEFIVCLGAQALELLTDKKSIDKWHLSPLFSKPEIGNFKVIGTFGLRRVNMEYSLQLYLNKTFVRVAEGLKDGGAWKPKVKNFHLNPNFDETMDILKMLQDIPILANDIETGGGQINTVGFAWSPSDAIAIQTLPDRFSADKYKLLWNHIAQILENPEQGKIFQNLTYESMYYSRYGIQIRNFHHDTMWAMRLLWPEFEIGLDNVGRLYTNEPYWKDTGKDYKAEGGKRDWSNIKNWPEHFRYNCLSKDMKVYTDQGWLPISKIVLSKLQCSVYSWDEKKFCFVWKPVTKWLAKKENKNIEWTIIKTEAMGNKHGLHVTPDHKILTQRGWVRADQLKVGDYMLKEGVRHNMGTLLGTLLGDSCLANTTDKTVAYMGCSQINKELIELKQKLFTGTITSKYRKTGYGENTFYNLYVPACAQLARLNKHNSFISMLDKLSPMGLALWFMDDGCLQKGKYPNMKLALQAYKGDEVVAIKDFFISRYNETCSIDKAKNLTMPPNMARKFCAEIGPYIVPSMRHKLAYPAPNYSIEACLEYCSKVEPINIRIVSITKGQKRKRGYSTSYCISVADTHNFLTEYGIVANCLDTSGTYEAYVNQKADLEHRGLSKFYYNYMIKLADPLAEMCSRGLPVNENTRTNLQVKLESEIKELTQSLSIDINPKSPKQKLELLKSKGYKIPKIRVGGVFKESTNELSLKKLRLKHPDDKDLDILLKLTHLNKAISSYIDIDYDSDGKLRFMLNGAGTETLRFSCSKDPWDRGLNAQTLPSKYKVLFDAPPGKLWLAVDLAQAESRFVAYDSCDENLIKMIEDPNEDIHKFVASHIFEKPQDQIVKSERQLGKKSGHGANYDMAANTFMESCLKEMDLVITKAEAQRILTIYHSLFPGIRQWHAAIRKTLWDKRKLSNPLGYERYFYGRMDDNTFREAYAFKPQSTIPMITNHLMLGLYDKRREGHFEFDLHLQVHDSVLLMVNDDPDQYLPIVEYCYDIKKWHPSIILPAGQLWIPTECEMGNNLGQLKEIHL